MSPAEFPPELRVDTPAGTPQAETAQEQIADVWCPCGYRWTYNAPEGYTCDEQDAPGHGENAQEYGAIPCQPATQWNPAERPDMAERREQVADRLRAEGIDPDR